MRLHRPALAVLALGTVLQVSAASAATGVAAAGSAVSSATIATVSVGGLTIGTTTIPANTISLGTLSATAQTLSSAAPAVSFVPVTVNGAKKGAITVTPANSPQTVGGVASGALPLNVLSATSPAATLKAAKSAAGPVSELSASLGSVSILGMPVSLDGGLNVGSATDAKHARAGKVLTIKNVSLPNLADLLAALGIDISKLPVDTLTSLVNELPITLDDVTSGDFDDAIFAVGEATGDLSAAQGTLATETAQLATATNDLNQALAGYEGVMPALPAPVEAPLNNVDWDALAGLGAAGTAAQDALRLDSAIDEAADAYEAAKPQYQAAFDAIAPLRAALKTATDALAGVVEGILAGTPLVKIGAAEVGTKANVTGTAKTADVTGYVSGVEVMGEDVLKMVTGSSKIDAAKLVNDAAGKVNAEIAGITETLAGVLSSATGATGLVVPAPKIEVLTKQTSTGVSGAFGTAAATVNALSVSIGSATIPAAYALEDAAEMAGIGQTASGFRTAPLSIKVGTLNESAKFRPASSTTGNPGTKTPGQTGSHPSTGLPAGLALIAMIGVGVAFAARRHLRAE